mmetsp:Transcript_4666/g.6147  ORF Transcript_4666/g.6147 Transcript_4666/m.6147 type:complete len:86 (+) Transcript_4666:121-378(+)
MVMPDEVALMKIYDVHFGLVVSRMLLVANDSVALKHFQSFDNHRQELSVSAGLSCGEQFAVLRGSLVAVKVDGVRHLTQQDERAC